MNNVMLYRSLAACLVCAGLYLLYPQAPNNPKVASGSILYGIRSGGALYKVDVMNCTACLIANFGGSGGTSDVLVLPNGDILVQSGGLFRYTLPSTTPIWSDVTSAYEGSVLAPNGTIYLTRIVPSAGLATYDPATNAITYLGDWPPGMIISEFFYQNGVLYGFGVQSGSAVLVAVNTTNPGLTTVVTTAININSGGTTNNGYTTANGASVGSDQLYQYNVSTNTFEFVCDLDAFILGSGGFSGLSDLPPGVPEALCLCTTFAGTVNTPTFNVCVPGSATVPYNNNAVLGAGDILRYILFSNPADTLGSIIVQSSSPAIAFDPATMQTGVTYYLATLAGDNVGGNVDLNDPCLDVSNTAAQVIWRALPTVVFSASNPNLCAGQCLNVTATFTGAPPFLLMYTTPFGTFTQTFPSNTGTFQVCAPTGTPPGPLQVQAISLTDTWCTCQ